ncbi:hypothetical protein B0A55_08106 [Friedmanniomyces simplex]|uniref:Uncharacterized protein n=1 Tax=Friedmanniomyces simplex TaxID=329884 RepID=A0A4U0WZH4_9PEZI|nr:hypothetical protein B0A55_08106 [Friedmanniomyces simplex]
MSNLPVVDPAWLTAPEVQDVAVAAFKRTRQIGEKMQALGGTNGAEYFPGPKRCCRKILLAAIDPQAPWPV